MWPREMRSFAPIIRAYDNAVLPKAALPPINLAVWLRNALRFISTAALSMLAALGSN
jgi:hypothetical protein